METKKVIQINPSLLRVSDKTRRKRAPRGGGGDDGGVTLSERSEKSKVTSANLVKKQILNKIRQNYKNAVATGGGSDSEIDDIPIHTDNNDFENSVKYFENLKKSMNPPSQLPPVQLPSQQPIYSVQQPQTAHQTENFGGPPAQMPQAPPLPQYGCLKGGSLPTFRNWQKTQKNPNYYTVSGLPDAPAYTPPVSINNSYYQPPSFSQAPLQAEQSFDIQNAVDNNKQPSDWQKEKERIHQIMEQRRIIENSAEVARNAAPTKKRKITRRTYHVGKSKIHPKVSVLLSNKTIRSQIMTEKQHYNEIPIQDVRQYLQKKGLIKIGSNSPNHVLRSMYESAMLLGGDIVNHNKDTLLHNFLKGEH